MAHDVSKGFDVSTQTEVVEVDHGTQTLAMEDGEVSIDAAMEELLQYKQLAAEQEMELARFRQQAIACQRDRTSFCLSYRGPRVALNPSVTLQSLKLNQGAIKLRLTAYDRILRYLFTLKNEPERKSFSMDVPGHPYEPGHTLM